jgi:hypothetical protein
MAEKVTRWFLDTEFKRVDGPHPAEAMAPPTLPLPPRPLSPSAPTGTCPGCGADYGHAHRPGCTWNTRALAETHCPECPTALTTETVGRAPFCRVCTERRERAAVEPWKPGSDYGAFAALLQELAELRAMKLKVHELAECALGRNPLPSALDFDLLKIEEITR